MPAKLGYHHAPNAVLGRRVGNQPTPATISPGGGCGNKYARKLSSRSNIQTTDSIYSENIITSPKIILTHGQYSGTETYPPGTHPPCRDPRYRVARQHHREAQLFCQIGSQTRNRLNRLRLDFSPRYPLRTCLSWYLSRRDRPEQSLACLQT